MEQLPELGESVQGFLDYKAQGISLVGAKVRGLEVGDLVFDKSGIMGVVKFQSEKYGNLIEFVDGLEVYDKKIGQLKKLAVRNMTFFNHNQRYYGFITRLARIIAQSLENDFPYVNIQNNGKFLYVRASTLQQITKQFTYQKISHLHNYMQFTLTPFWTCHLNKFEVKAAWRKSRFAYNVLRDLFIDIDLMMEGKMMIKFIISDKNEYNNDTWAKMYKHFGKFHLKKARA